MYIYIYIYIYQNHKEVKPSYQVLRVSCKRVLLFQSVHNELTLCLKWNSILFQTGSARCSGPTLH